MEDSKNSLSVLQISAVWQLEDKWLKQTPYDFQVHCTNKSKGCEWTGELRELNSHLNENPRPLSYAGYEACIEMTSRDT